MKNMLHGAFCEILSIILYKISVKKNNAVMLIPLNSGTTGFTLIFCTASLDLIRSVSYSQFPNSQNNNRPLYIILMQVVLSDMSQ